MKIRSKRWPQLYIGDQGVVWVESLDETRRRVSNKGDLVVYRYESLCKILARHDAYPFRTFLSPAASPTKSVCQTEPDQTTSSASSAAIASDTKVTTSATGSPKHTVVPHDLNDRRVYCICRRRADADRFMVGCDAELPGCKQWYHGECVGFKSEADVPETWKCSICSAATTTAVNSTDAAAPVMPEVVELPVATISPTQESVASTSIVPESVVHDAAPTPLTDPADKIVTVSFGICWKTALDPWQVTDMVVAFKTKQRDSTCRSADIRTF